MLSAEAAITLAGVRGREMAAACALEPTGMAAVLGGDPDEVLAAIDAHGLHPANRNGAGQIVAAGSLDGLDKLAAEPPAEGPRHPPPGGRRVPHPVHGPGRDRAGRGGRRDHPRRPRPDPAVEPRRHRRQPTASELVHRLVRQVTAPVRWDLCMRTLADLGVTGVIELPPAGTLAGLVKRELKGEGAPEIVTLNTPDDLPAAGPDRPARRRAPGRRPAPGGGRRRPSRTAEGADRPTAHRHVAPQGRRVTAHAGLLTEWLAHDDDPVTPGQPLARIESTQR